MWLLVAKVGWRGRKGMGKQEEMGKEKKKPQRQSFLAERRQAVKVCECVVFFFYFFLFFFFVISNSLDVAGA